MTRLEAAIEKLDANKMTPAEQAAAGLETVDAAINTLESTVKSTATGLGGKSFRTYMLYRWSRYQDAVNDANYAINLSAEYNAGLQTQKFPYSSMPVYQLKEVVAGNAYSSYILALLEDLNDEELAQSRERFKEVTRNYGGYTTLDIAQYSNLVTRMAGRLLPREGGVVNTYLSKEINSAKAVIGSTNTKGYSTRSWNAYADALANAEAAMTSTSQDTIFDAKYQLQVARNNLRTANEEADYKELGDLIKQAEQVLVNRNLYNNTPEEFGALLAALGYEITKDVVTYDIFPGAAKNIDAVSIEADDQEDVDDAADALKVALSKMKFNVTSYGSASVNNESVPTGEFDKNDNPITESVKTTVIPVQSILSAVTSKFNGTSATGANTIKVKVSLDDNYTLTEENTKFVGTGATVTIYSTTSSGIDIPISTVKIVVKGDVNGDGVIDVIDCMMLELVITSNTSLTGVYNLAGDFAENDAIDETDFDSVVNKVAGR